MNKKLLELLDKINAQKTTVKDYVDAGKIDDAKAAKNELKNLQTQFDLLKDLEDETPAIDGMTPGTTPETDAVADFASRARQRFATNMVQETTGPQGGYTVPEDIQTRINQYKSSHASLREYVTVENVSTNKGSRTYEAKATLTGFTKIDAEGNEIGAMQEPAFERITFAINDYAGYLPVTNDVLADSDANLTSYITDWIGRQALATDNREILAALTAETAETVDGLDGIKKILNVTLGQAYKATSVVLVNDDGLNWLDTLTDENGRYLLNPNPTDSAQLQLRAGASVVPVVVVPNSEWASNGDGSLPVVIGDLAEAIGLFDRNSTEILASNVASVGSFNAFAKNLTLFRAIVRADYQIKDSGAFVYGKITPEAKP